MIRAEINDVQGFIKDLVKIQGAAGKTGKWVATGGVLLAPHDGLTMVATDGHKLVKIRYAADVDTYGESSASDGEGVILTERTISVIKAKYAKSATTELCFRFHEGGLTINGKLVFDRDDLIQGSFPPYQSIIDSFVSCPATKFDCDFKHVQSACTASGTKGFKVEFSKSPATMRLTGGDNDQFKSVVVLVGIKSAEFV